MILPCGAFIQVRRVGIDAHRPHVTAHLVDFWASQADHDAGKPPVATHDVLTHWSGPHDNPAGRIVDILDRWVKRGGLRRPAGTKPSLVWADGPDTHGNLKRARTDALKAVTT
jgi:hypothetical protein